MGQCSSQSMKKEELEEYEVLTFLTKKEILRIQEAFCKSCPQGKDYRQEKLTVEKVCTWPQLKANPFRDRICKLFSTDGYFMFEDILKMASVFSHLACHVFKIDYAFQIYDFNEDGFIDEEDLQNVIRRVLDNKNFREDLIVSLAKQILMNADLNNDKMLCETEFEYAMKLYPDFLKTIRIDF